MKRNWMGLNGNETRQRMGQCHSNTRLAEALQVMVPALRDIEIRDEKFAVVTVLATVPVPVNPKEVEEWLTAQMSWIVPVPIKAEFQIRRRARGL